MKQLSLMLLSAFLLFGCQDHTNPNDPEPKTPTGDAKTVGGVIEKGPFITGTSIKLQILDKNLNPTGKTFEKQIENDFGGFLFENIEADYVEMIATGYYFNELNGTLSKSTITLRSIAKISSDQPSNINLLTTLQSPRLKKLITEGKSFDDAVKQSQSELLQAFNIKNSTTGFDQMNITQAGDGNAILLAVSVVLQKNRNEAQLSEFVAKLANDLADNGTVDNAALTNEILQSSQSISSYDAARTIENILKRYSDLGKGNVTVANFYNYIDSDGDGKLNNESSYLDILQTACGVARRDTTVFLTVLCNSKTDVHIPAEAQWVTINESLCSDAVLALNVAENTDARNRSATVVITNSDNSVQKTVDIKQDGAGTKFNVMLPTLCQQTKAIVITPIEDVAFLAFDANGNNMFSHYDDKISYTYSAGYAFFTEKITAPINKIYAVINGGTDFSAFNGTFGEFTSQINAININKRIENCMHTGFGEARLQSNGQYYVDVLNIGHAFSQLQVYASKSPESTSSMIVNSISIKGAVSNNIFDNVTTGSGSKTSAEITIPLDMISSVEMGIYPPTAYVDTYFIDKLIVTQVDVTINGVSHVHSLMVPLEILTGAIYKWNIVFSDTGLLYLNTATGQFHVTNTDIEL